MVATSELWLVDLSDLQAVALDNANHGSGLSFYPTMSPVAAGGYFWLFFTSRRTYGNILDVPVDNIDSKKIWVTAINVETSAEVEGPIEDRSHPAFYLPGQELDSGNVRAFASLDPCKQNGEPCESGVECCSGFCTDGVCGPPQDCAEIDEGCQTAADCCDESAECIAGFCAVPPPR